MAEANGRNVSWGGGWNPAFAALSALEHFFFFFFFPPGNFQTICPSGGGSGWHWRATSSPVPSPLTQPKCSVLACLGVSCVSTSEPAADEAELGCKSQLLQGISFFRFLPRFSCCAQQLLLPFVSNRGVLVSQLGVAWVNVCVLPCSGFLL